MLQLKEEEFMVLKQYNGLLDSLEEAFAYLCENAEVLSAKVNQQVKQDSYKAITKLVETHVLMVDWFNEQEAALRSIAEFERFIDELETLGHFENQHVSDKEVFATYVIPAFEQWKKNMQKQLIPLLAH
ncbi:hypothetical protein [Sutcliffiella deserti]|uniref:hypothetical protein n=1 Tax=Sutcliffiella deserti TaxID=2875501 RepID=UPI001CBE5BE5|nr:hypothetical protein [Sutcliffiella deserti]